MYSKTILEPIFPHWDQTRIEFEITETERLLISGYCDEYIKANNLKPTIGLKIGLNYPKTIMYNDVVIGVVTTIIASKKDNYTVSYIKKI